MLAPLGVDVDALQRCVRVLESQRATKAASEPDIAICDIDAFLAAHHRNVIATALSEAAKTCAGACVDVAVCPLACVSVL